MRIVDWQQANASFFNAIKVERNVMFLILTLIILVAAFNIISGMIMMVKDKGRDIAILRTMGATRGMVMRVFLLAGASVGIIGTAIGFGLGIAFAGNIETIRQWLQGLTGTELFAAEIYFLSCSCRRWSKPRRSQCRRHVAWSVVPGGALSSVAGRASRSGGGAAI